MTHVSSGPPDRPTSNYQDPDYPAYATVDGHVATVSLNRPANYNAIDLEMAVRLRALMMEIAQNPDVRVVIIRGEGPAFCGGGDILHFIENLDTIGDSIRALLTPYHDFLLQLQHMPKLVVASVHGAVAGAGLSLVSMSDFCVAAEDARFTPAYSNIAVSPDGGGTFGMARSVGTRRALQIFLNGDSFSAEQAVAWGLATQAVPPADLDAAARILAGRLAMIEPLAAANTKRLLRTGGRVELGDHLNDEMESLIRCMQTDAFASAIRQFVRR